MSYLATNLKKLRKAKRLSQTEFAKIFGLTRSAVGSYEEGRAEPKLDKLIEIARYFDLTLDQLVAKKLSVNEIYHYDRKLAFARNAVPFVDLAAKKEFIHHLKTNTPFNYKQILIPTAVADIAIEVDTFAGLKNCIVFGKKFTKSEPDAWYISVTEKDYVISYGLKNYAWIRVWQICCLFTKDIDHLSTQEIRLERIEQKIDRLLMSK